MLAMCALYGFVLFIVTWKLLNLFAYDLPG